MSSQTSSSNRRPSRSDREEYFARRQSSSTVRREGEMCGRVPRLRLTLRRARIVGEAIAVVIAVERLQRAVTSCDSPKPSERSRELTWSNSCASRSGPSRTR